MTFDYESFWESKLDDLRAEGRYRVFADLERIAGSFPKARYRALGKSEREVTVWCSNDYLGMGQHPVVLDAMREAIARYGAGSGGTRNISGTNHEHVLLEDAIARLHSKERGLLFNSGFSANEAGLSALGHALPECAFLSDEDNHASMIAGMRNCRADKNIFRHNDVDHLRELLSGMNPERPKVVAVESVYSMTGDAAPLSELADVTHEHGGLFFVDEVHAVGLYGQTGAGLAQQLGIESKIDLLSGTLGKAFGVSGGYIAGSDAMVDTVRSFAPSFIFTTSIPPHVAAGARASVQYLMESNVERQTLFTRVAQLREELARTDIKMMNNSTHIVPVLIGDPIRCKEIASILLDEWNIYVQPINYPTVSRGTERLRLTASPYHSEDDVYVLVEALSKAWALTTRF